MERTDFQRRQIFLCQCPWTRRLQYSAIQGSRRRLATARPGRRARSVMTAIAGCIGICSRPISPGSRRQPRSRWRMARRADPLYGTRLHCRGGIRYVQFDATRAAGFTEALRIAHLAEPQGGPSPTRWGMASSASTRNCATVTCSSATDPASASRSTGPLSTGTAFALRA